MKYLYAIRDKKTDIFSSPIIHANNAEAVRHLDMLVRRVSDDPHNSLVLYPEDFALYCLASWHDAEDLPIAKSVVMTHDGGDEKIIDVASLPFFVKNQGEPNEKKARKGNST